MRADRIVREIGRLQPGDRVAVLATTPYGQVEGHGFFLGYCGGILRLHFCGTGRQGMAVDDIHMLARHTPKSVKTEA